MVQPSFDIGSISSFIDEQIGDVPNRRLMRELVLALLPEAFYLKDNPDLVIRRAKETSRRHSN